LQIRRTIPEQPGLSPSPIRLLAVIVLYKLTPAKSASLQSLLAAKEEISEDRFQLRILLYDNTPGGQDPGLLASGVDYEAAHANRGLAAAYNRSLEIATAHDFDWLLTLDQDTTLPRSFLTALGHGIDQVAAISEIAAVVPQITGEGRMLSPNYFLFDVLPRFYPKGFTGIPSRDTYAFNSASTLRVSALRDIGGYDPLFWLDNSDAYVYRRLHLHGKRVYVAGDIQVDHEFSMFDIKKRVSLDRYQGIVDAGCAFWDLELGTVAGLYHTASLVYRLFNHWRRGDDPEIRRITRKTLWKRIFQSRKRRIEDWRRSVQLRESRLVPHCDSDVRSTNFGRKSFDPKT
jgi:glycosyltransferase involved in cell wall biosynthesis